MPKAEKTEEAQAPVESQAEKQCGFNITVQRSALLKELDLVMGAVPTKATVPILGNILLRVQGKELEIQATDLGIAHRTTVECLAGGGAGSVCVPGKRFHDIVKALPEEVVHLTSDEDFKFKIACGKSSFKLSSLSGETFPALPEQSGKDVIHLPALCFARHIQLVKFAVSTEETRYTLNGALLVVKPKGYVLVATDGHRLSVVEHRQEIPGVTQERQVLVSLAALTELGKVLETSDDNATLEMGQTENHQFFKFRNRLLVCRRLEGKFPNYEAVLPKEHKTSSTFAAADFSKSLKRVALLADGRTHSVTMDLQDPNITIQSSSIDVGDAKEEFTAVVENGPNRISFNAHYILEFLGQVENGADVAFRMNDDTSAAEFVVLPEGEGNAFKHRYVVMPMRA